MRLTEEQVAMIFNDQYDHLFWNWRSPNDLEHDFRKLTGLHLKVNCENDEWIYEVDFTGADEQVAVEFRLKWS